MPGFGTASSRRKGNGGTMTTMVAGIDVSRDDLDAHGCGEHRGFANDRDGFRALDGWLRGHGSNGW